MDHQLNGRIPNHDLELLTMRAPCCRGADGLALALAREAVIREHLPGRRPDEGTESQLPLPVR